MKSSSYLAGHRNPREENEGEWPEGEKLGQTTSKNWHTWPKIGGTTWNYSKSKVLSAQVR